MELNKILLISFQIPYPLNSGGSIAQYYFLNKMTEEFDVTFCSIVHNQFQKENIAALASSFPKLSIEFLDLSLSQESNQNDFVKLSTKYINRIQNRFNRNKSKKNGYHDFHVNSVEEKFILLLQDIFKLNTYDFIQLDFFETISLLPVLPDESKKVFVHHEIRAKRNELLNPNNFYSQYLNSIIKSHETALLNLADAVIVFNNEDRNYLNELKVPVHISPFGIPDELIIKNQVSNQFENFLFMGNENHYPNKEGLFWFLEKIYLPNLDKIKLPIFITGEWSAAFKKKYSEHKAINFVGFLEDLSSLYDQSIMISPIISGSGLRTKILHAYANSVPVISTKFASEGLFDTESDNNHIFHFENDKDFVKISETILKNQYLLKEVAINGNRYYLKNFDFNNLLHKRFEAYSLK